jgi:putative transposase
VFHVCNRGVLKKPIFLDEFDYHICEEILGESAQKYGVPLYAYCLMPNHWHMLVEAPTGETLVKMLQRFSSTHARALRKKQENQGTGAVYQSRYRAHAVQKNESFLRVQKYIEQNPVKAGLCPTPKDWPWSSASEKTRPLEIRQANFPIPKAQSSDPAESWHTRIESALYGQRPLGDLAWQKALQGTSRKKPALGLLAA